MLRDLKLPEVPALQKQLKLLYAMRNLKASDEQVYRESWGIKAACGFVKRKGKRNEVTREACLNLVSSCSCQGLSDAHAHPGLLSAPEGLATGF